MSRASFLVQNFDDFVTTFSNVFSQNPANAIRLLSDHQRLILSASEKALADFIVRAVEVWACARGDLLSEPEIRYGSHGVHNAAILSHVAYSFRKKHYENTTDVVARLFELLSEMASEPEGANKVARILAYRKYMQMRPAVAEKEEAADQGDVTSELAEKEGRSGSQNYPLDLVAPGADAEQSASLDVAALDQGGNQAPGDRVNTHTYPPGATTPTVIFKPQGPLGQIIYNANLGRDSVFINSYLSLVLRLRQKGVAIDSLGALLEVNRKKEEWSFWPSESISRITPMASLRLLQMFSLDDIGTLFCYMKEGRRVTDMRRAGAIANYFSINMEEIFDAIGQLPEAEKLAMYGAIAQSKTIKTYERTPIQDFFGSTHKKYGRWFVFSGTAYPKKAQEIYDRLSKQFSSSSEGEGVVSESEIQMGAVSGAQ